MTAIRYWPFEVLPEGKRTDRHKQVIAFLEAGFDAGFRPYVFDESNYGASSSNGRIGELIHRGAQRYWQVLLRIGDDVKSSFYVDGFDNAGSAILQWLTGDEIPQITLRLQPSIVAAPGIRGWKSDAQPKPE